MAMGCVIIVIDRLLEDPHTLDGRTVEVKRAIPREKTAMGAPRLVTVDCVSSEAAAKSGGEGEEDTIKLSRATMQQEKPFANLKANLPSCIRRAPHVHLSSPCLALSLSSFDSVVLTLASCVSSDFRSGGGRGGAPATYTESKKIFVGGLPPTVTEQDFRKYFEEYGRITDAVVMIDRDTQRSRGFGFVSFDEEVRGLCSLDVAAADNRLTSSVTDSTGSRG